MMPNSYFLLFANCIVVKGASRSTICDLQNGFYVFIPNVVADILIDLEKLTIENALLENTEVEMKALNSYFDYFIKHNLGHFCTNLINFPKINTQFQKPNKIEDCIIELSDSNYNNMSYIVKSLKNLGCTTLELRAYKSFSLNKITKILELLQDSRIRNVELYLKYSDKISPDLYSTFLDSNHIIGLFVVHSCNNKTDTDIDSKVFFTEQKITSSNCCGKILKEDFVINLPFYLEGLKHNTCLNRKVSITENGDIKNCPSLLKNYGNITKVSIEKAVNKDEFKELWGINKDKVDVCRDCEFRHICSDCRAYVESNFSKPKNCNYDPYTMSYSV